MFVSRFLVLTSPGTGEDRAEGAKSDTRQVQQKLCGIESYGFMHDEAWARPDEASKPEFLHMARPKRDRARPTLPGR